MVTWETTTLEGISSNLVRGPFGGALKKEIFVQSGYKVYEQQDAIYGKDAVGRYFITLEKYNELSRFAISGGDFIVSCSGTIGRIYRLPKNSPAGVINQALLKITIDENQIVPDYFLQYFRWENFQQSITDDTQGGAMKNLVGMDIFRLTEIPLPLLPEQRRIATALSDTDALITALERLIVKKRAIKQGAMQELLTGKRRLPGFEGEWVEKKLGELGIVTGSGVDKKVNEDEIPVTLLNYLDVYRYTYIKRGMLHQVVTAKREKLLQCNVLCGDVFFTPTSETADDIARTAVAIEDMDDVVYSYHVVRLRPFDGYNGVFIKYACDTVDFTEQTARLADGSGTRYIISLPNFREQLEIKIPPIHEEQTAIAEILSDMDAEIDKLTARLKKLRNIKQGMMSELLTGRIRLVEQDAATITETSNAVMGRE